ncbi:MMPL family transporter [Geothrix sp. PMB-07]|uniref:MMPL family transporter n=1 Tax=Geothrix sp. PMB-07 TaxID=3068640 RepID=UPI0027426A95|nr:MMPL family transporter [Geothrix sp. PMB-07]WLT31656.1 MMPL family transporter [Geothrix sp. PMB-07]
MKALLRVLLRLHLSRSRGLWLCVAGLTLLLGWGTLRVERALDLMSLLPSEHPAVRANLEAGVGQQELIWLVAEGGEADLEVRRAWAEGLVDRLLTEGNLPLNGLAAEGRLSDPIPVPGPGGVSPWPALLAVGAIAEGDAAVSRLTTETLYTMAPAWLGDRLAPLTDLAALQRRLQATAKALSSPEPLPAALARLDPLGLRDLAPQDGEGMAKATALGRAFTLKVRTGYFETKDGRFVMLPLVAGFPATDAKATTRVLTWLGRGAKGPLPVSASLRDTEAALAPIEDLKEGRAFPLQVTGAHAITAWESHRLTVEVVLSLALSFLLIGLVYWLGFRTLAGYGFVMVPLLVGMVWALGLTGWVLGRVNLMAAGFGAVLLGVGDDVGILLFSRYRDDRRAGHTKPRALRAAMLGTGPGVVAGALATSMAFLALAFAPFPGIRDLGLTTGLGLLACLAATFLVLPPLLLTLDRGRGTFAPGPSLPGKPRRRWAPWAALAVLMVALVGAPRTRWEEDLRRFRAQGNPALTLQERLTRTLGASLQPLALQIPLEDPDRLPARWNKLSPILREAGLPVPDWKSLDPELRHALGSETWRRQVLEAASKAGLDPAGLEGPLTALAEAASDPTQPVAALQAMLPRAAPREERHPWNLWDGFHQHRKPPPLAPALSVPLRLDEASLNRLTPVVEAAGGRFVGTQPLFRVVKGIAKEAVQQAVLLALAGIFLVIAAFGRSLRFAVLALVPLLASQAGVFGALGWGGEPLTFLSLMAIPIALGVSVDTAFNLLHRARGEKDAPQRVARVNAVCAGTTLAGFGGMVFSGYRGLRGLGLACLGGVALALLLTQWLLPVLLEKWPLEKK